MNDPADRSDPSGSADLPRTALAVGTQVVLLRDIESRPAGSVGSVVAADPRGVSVRFADGDSAQVSRRDLRVRKSQSPDLEERAIPVAAVEPFLVFRATVGSRAYGLSREGSDHDDRGIFLPPADWTWSLFPVPEQIEFFRTAAGVVSIDRNAAPTGAGGERGDDHCWWELEKFLRLAIRANPTALEVLHVAPDHVVLETPVGAELRALAPRLLSRHLYQTFSGYALSQFRRMDRARRRGTEPKAKHAMHLVRLLLTGIEAVRSGMLTIDVTPHRDELLAIRDGETPFAAVHARALELVAMFETAFRSSPLPGRPDVAAADDFLIRARRSVT